MKKPLTARFIDSHCHIDDPIFSDLPAVLAAAQAYAVEAVVVPGLYESQWQTLQRLSQQYRQLYVAYGRHPWWVNAVDDIECFAQALFDMADQNHCVAIGETGIDGLKPTDLALQQRWFEQHIRIAVELDKPVIVHAVRAHPQIQQTLAKYKGRVRGVIHGFSGSPELAQQYWRLGFYLGIGGTITYPRGSKTQRAVQAMPLEALLLETDAPDMPLHGRQGQANHPRYVAEIARCVARLKGVEVELVAEATASNTSLLFGF